MGNDEPSDQNRHKPIARIVKCPSCKKSVAYSASNPHRPFCSERCRMTDLGTWANEDYRIPIEGNEKIEHNDDDND